MPFRRVGTPKKSRAVSPRGANTSTYRYDELYICQTQRCATVAEEKIQRPQRSTVFLFSDSVFFQNAPPTCAMCFILKERDAGADKMMAKFRAKGCPVHFALLDAQGELPDEFETFELPSAESAQGGGADAGARAKDTETTDAEPSVGDANSPEPDLVGTPTADGEAGAEDRSPPRADEPPPDFFCVWRLPDTADRLLIQRYRDKTVESAEECALSDLPLAVQPTLAHAPDIHVICDRGDAALIEAGQSLQALASVYFTFLDPSATAPDWVAATEAGVEPADGGAGDADNEALIDPNEAGYRSEDPAEAMAYFNRTHFVTFKGSQASIGVISRGYDGTETVDFRTPRAMWVFHQPWTTGKKHAFDMWMASKERPTYPGVIFVPGEPRISRGYFNLFTGFAIDPVPGDCSLYWAHVRDVICSGVEEHFRYLRCWMAHMFQRPQERPEKAPVLVSKQGAGKGLFVEVLGFLLGRYYIMLTKMEQITGRFNAHLRDVVLIYANEALWRSGDDDLGTLKSLITDPSLAIEAKGVDAAPQPNYRRLIIASNFKRPIKLPPDDRRFFVLQVSNARIDDHPYFQALLHELANGGYAALLHDLLHVDLTGFNPRIAPHTKAELGMKLDWQEASAKWWYSCLKAGTLADDEWPAVVSATALFEYYTRWCEQQGRHSQPQNVFGRELANLLADTDFMPTRTGPADNRTRGYVLPPLAAAREAFQRLFKQGPDIWAA
ncbi:MAG: hypothetical protein A3K19_29830 [Lentisphaerae bacterium RIFOXYB12_FULL_65_16]|nr:MAG: hypothetical protein A3K18_33440 [Lentisphaerae bacterium RIFOXYA12_64_32]OGV86529.1 MAG: hypothetical protein A3K19_29830 [Lentisphaerae bacterium RIFOXYB12_FULL_65_16]